MVNHSHNSLLSALSVLIAIFASYTALDLASSLTVARGRARLAWLGGGSLAMGVGIWSMHFVAMLAFSVPGLAIAYDVPLLILSVIIAIVASAIALLIVSRENITRGAYSLGSLSMGAAIAGMHYVGIAAMRMEAEIQWDWLLVLASILIAVTASFAALWLAFSLREDVSTRGSWTRGGASVLMGLAISGMHYTAMAAMHLVLGSPAPLQDAAFQDEQLLATSGLAVSVIGTTLLILGIALTGSIVDRALARKTAMTEQIRRILESITDAFFSVDKNWKVTYINRVAQQLFRQMTEKDPENLIGQSMWQTFPELAGTRFETEYRRAMKDAEPAHFEEFFRPSDQWIEAHVYPSSEGLSIYFRNVTDRKKYEQTLQEAIRARDEFLSICSHELKTPLTSLKLQAQMRQKAVSKGDQAAFALDRLKLMFEGDSRQIERLTRLIDDILDISRISTGKLTLNREQFDFCELAQEVIERYRYQLEAAGCKTTIDLCPPVCGHWDRFRLEQALTNLLTNAMKYGAGKPVHVEIENTDLRAVRLSVKDEGMGISNENQERIFQRFERAISANEISGLGLGLYITQQIVEMHGGRIWVESELGKGSTFTVELNLDDQLASELST